MKVEEVEPLKIKGKIMFIRKQDIKNMYINTPLLLFSIYKQMKLLKKAIYKYI